MIVRPVADGVEVLAPAKLNLFLEVLGRRPDGYHEIESLMVAVDLYDTLDVRRRPIGGDHARAATIPSLPTGRENLVVRAAERLQARVGMPARGAASTCARPSPRRRGWPAARATRRRRWWPWIGSGTCGPRPTGWTPWPAEIGSDVAFFLTCPGGGLPRPGRAGGASRACRSRSTSCWSARPSA